MSRTIASALRVQREAAAFLSQDARGMSPSAIDADAELHIHKMLQAAERLRVEVNKRSDLHALIVAEMYTRGGDYATIAKRLAADPRNKVALAKWRRAK